jgi:hypothetical protein
MLPKIKNFLFLIKCRIKKPDLILYFILHEISKKFKINFNTLDSDFSEIDIVIPTIPKNFDTINNCIDYAKKNLNHKVNKIYIISPETEEIKKFCEASNFIFVDENTLLGYKSKDINYQYKNINRSGWIFQQLLKLSADKITEKDNFLVVDSDTMLINKHTFITKEGKFVLFQSSEWHEEYMETFKKIFNESPISKLSLISHMMIFNKKMLNDFKSEIESKNNKKWDELILSLINPNDISYFSEYESYGNWLIKNHSQKIALMPFYNKSITNLEDFIKNENKYKKYYNSISIHKYQS